MEYQQQAHRQDPPTGQARVRMYFVLSHEQFPVPHLIDLGVMAEQAGFDGVWASDHFQPWQDNQGHAGLAWITLAALGQRVERITMGTGVTCPTYRYRPPVVAQAFASLSLLSPGRVFLGVGTGEALNEIPGGGGWGTYQERSRRLEEAITLIRRLWTGDWVTYQGSYYQIDRARLYDAPLQPVPIYVAAGGPNSMRLAGKHGDGLVTDAKRAGQPELRAAFAEGARGAGKDPTTMPILAEHMVVVGDRREAERWAPLWRFMPKAWEYVNDPDPRSIQRQAEADIALESVYNQWLVSEDPQAHIQAIRQLAADGVTDVFVHSPQQDQARVLNFYAQQVLPNLSAQAHPTGAR